MSPLTRFLLRFFGWLTLRGDLQAQRARQERNARWTPLPPGVRCTPVSDGPVPGEWVAPPVPAPGVMLYLHGGGYVVGSPKAHRVLTAPLAAALGVRLFVPDYRLAPEHPFPAALEDALAAWDWLAGQTDGPLWLGGDSAGGGLALAVLLRLRDEAGFDRRNRRPPAGALLFSPWADLTLSGESARQRVARDPILTPAFLDDCARHYAGQTPRSHPLLSPLFADLGGLPRLLIHVGTEEILLDDARRLTEKARAAGVDVCLRIWEGMPHVFPLFPFFRESRQALAESREWLRPQG